MTDKLPPNLLALFAPRPPLRWLEAPDHAPERRKTAPIDSVAAYLPELEKYKETDVYNPTESWLQGRDRKKREKQEALTELMTQGPKICEEDSKPVSYRHHMTDFFFQISQMKTQTSVVMHSKP